MKRQPPTFEEMMKRAVAVPLLMPGTPVWIALEYQRMKHGASTPALAPVPVRGIVHDVWLAHYWIDLDHGGTLPRLDRSGDYSRDCHNVYANEEEAVQCAGTLERIKSWKCGRDPHACFDDFASFAGMFPPSMKPKPWRP